MTASPSSPRVPFTARLIQKPLVWAVVMGALFGIPVYRSMTRRLTASPPILGGLPAFTLTEATCSMGSSVVYLDACPTPNNLTRASPAMKPPTWAP